MEPCVSCSLVELQHLHSITSYTKQTLKYLLNEWSGQSESLLRIRSKWDRDWSGGSGYFLKRPSQAWQTEAHLSLCQPEVPCNQRPPTRMCAKVPLQTVLDSLAAPGPQPTPHLEPGLRTLALQAVTGQGKLRWQGAIHGWPQSALEVVQGCLQISSPRHSPLWQSLWHLCIPHGSVAPQGNPQEISTRWQGMLLRN